ncbi:metallophosphoesterase [Bariatricus sp. SGI.161]|uniref:metallophosphoesterase n=1 Tax=Bariatricus sp. SGI.161 TaxID=3420550 RepID=UPI003CFD26F7
MKENSKKVRRYKNIFVSIVLLLIVLILGEIWCSSHWLIVRTYEYQSDKLEQGQGLKIAVLSDLHDHEFGEGNAKLVRKVKEQEPDLILLDGDFLNEDSENADVLCDLIKQSAEIAPVYFSPGNHELAYMENGHAELTQQLEEAGAVVLDEEYKDIEINNVQIRIGGMYDYAFALDGNDEAKNAPEPVKSFLEDYQNTDRLKLMMSHRPESFCLGNASSVWDVDLVISGHIHGGQVVLPILGGLYGGDQEWFPEYVHGMYQKDDMHIFVTSGLGSYGQLLPRFHNRPEIAMIEISK